MARAPPPPSFGALRAAIEAVHLAVEVDPRGVLDHWQAHYDAVMQVQAVLLERLPRRMRRTFARDFTLTILPGIGGLVLLGPGMVPMVIASLSLGGAFLALGQGAERYLAADRCLELLEQVAALRERLVALRAG
ncbi:MAG TPA: hypothetical protein VGN83_09235 [Falsiroseomonas sp.]|jgi:hypothetical protein|nr:hypothetical protein [Falsiroseomonas sp.]